MIGRGCLGGGTLGGPGIRRVFKGRVGRRLRGRFFLIVLEKMTRFFEVEQVAVHSHLVVAGVFSDGDDILHAMALFTERVH